MNPVTLSLGVVWDRCSVSGQSLSGLGSLSELLRGKINECDFRPPLCTGGLNWVIASRALYDLSKGKGNEINGVLG